MDFAILVLPVLRDAGYEQLRVIAHELLNSLKSNVTVDWEHREHARAKMRVLVKRILRKHGYPRGACAGALKTYGIRLAPVTSAHNRAGFRDQVQAVTAGDPVLEVVAASFIVRQFACADPIGMAVKLAEAAAISRW